MKAVLIKIRGKVQGVGFRNALTKQAKILQVDGWCRNRSDGSVEAWAQGEERAVQDLLAWCQQGPPLAEVTAVEASTQKLENSLEGFSRRETS